MSANVPEIIAKGPDVSIWHLISSADLIGQAVMLILVAASVFSWAIIVSKYKKYKEVKKKMLSFEEIFWSGQVLDTLFERVKKSVDNPMAAVFVAAFEECKRYGPSQVKELSLKVGLKERIGQAMYLVRSRENDRLEENLGFLATVGSSATFVGVFGTVCGIMHSFQSIAGSNNTSLAVVAPGIAEALLATAIGLITAIPAMVAYNMLASQVNSISNRVEDFSYELHTLLSRAIDEEKL